MSSEIRLNFNLTVTNGGFSDSFNSGNIAIDQAAIGSIGGVVIVGTSEEDLGIGDISTNGLLILKNLDATNFMEYGLNDAGSLKAIGRIKPGEIAFLRLKPGTTFRMQSNTAPTKIRYLLLEN